MSTREQVEAEAEDYACRHYADLHSHRAGAERGFIAGRTVSNEQIEAAAKAHHAAEDTTDTTPWEFEPLADDYRRCTRAAFRAAGFLIEGATQ